MINIRKRGNAYQYCFEAGKVNGKIKQITKCGFKTKNEAYTYVDKYRELTNDNMLTLCIFYYINTDNKLKIYILILL